MDLLVLLVLSWFSVISADDSQIERQNTENYDTLNRYKTTDTSSYGTSGGYYPRNAYEQYNQNRFNVDLSGKEFRPPNVFAVGLIPTPTPASTPFMSTLMAQPRQYQISMAGGPSGLMPFQVNGSPFLQSSGYSNQYSGLSPFAGVGARIGIGETIGTANQGYGGGYGNYLSDPYYGAGNRYGLAASPYGPNYVYPSFQPALAPLAQSQAYQMSYANPAYGLMSRGYGAYGFGPQFAAQPYQTSPLAGQSYTGLNSYNNYNNYNNNGLTQGGITEGIRDEKNYASSASTHSETHSSAHSADESPVFEANRLGKRTGGENRRTIRNDVPDYRTL